MRLHTLASTFDAGFNDLSTFNRRFRRVMGLAAGAYRKNSAGQPAPVLGRA